MTGAPDHLEITSWRAAPLPTNGYVNQAIPWFGKVFAAGPGWMARLRRLDVPGSIPDAPQGRVLVERVLRAAGSTPAP